MSESRPLDWPNEIHDLAVGALDALGVSENVKVMTSEYVLRQAMRRATEELKLMEQFLEHANLGTELDVDVIALLGGIRGRLGLAIDSGEAIARIIAGEAGKSMAEAAE